MNVIIVLGLFAMLVSVEALHAQEGPRPARPGAQVTTCNEFLPPPTRVADKRIGPEDCRIVSEETVFNLNGQRFRRRELRISGTAEGWAARQGPRSNYFSDGPDFVFTRSSNTAPRFKAIGRRFSQSAYVACVAKAAATLVAEGLLPPRVLAYYVKRAVASEVAEGAR